MADGANVKIQNEQAGRTAVSEDIRRWAALWRDSGPFSVVYADSTVLHDGMGRDADRRRYKLTENLSAAGSPPSDRDAVVRILSEPTGIGGKSARFLVVHDGEPVLDEILAGPMESQEIVEHTRVPNLLPLLIHHENDLGYLVVESGRDGGEIHAYRAHHTASLVSESVEGRTDSLNKVQAGRWSHSQYQHHSEEIWKQNQSLLAEAVDALVRELHPRLVVLAGDVRAVQLLTEELAPATREIATTIASHVRAAGASRAALQDHIAEKLDEVRRRDQAADDDRRAAGDFENAAVGVGPVIHALQQAQTETMLLSVSALENRTLLALASEPWVASAPEEALGATVRESARAAVALARAAILTDSRLMFVDQGRLPERAGVAAVLRWPTGPAVPGGSRPIV